MRMVTSKREKLEKEITEKSSKSEISLRESGEAVVQDVEEHEEIEFQELDAKVKKAPAVPEQQQSIEGASILMPEQQQNIEVEMPQQPGTSRPMMQE